MASRQEIVAEYSQSQASYERVVNEVVATLEAKLAAADIQANVNGRAKEVWSLATKLMMKERDGRPYPTMVAVPDLAGVRVVAQSLQDQIIVLQTVLDAFPGAAIDDKSTHLGVSALGYRGIHVQAKLGYDIGDIHQPNCEVQIRTGAEDLWNALSHELFYKEPVRAPAELQRRFNRLSVLVELFDAEVDATMKELEGHPSYQWRKLYSVLERLFKRVSPITVAIDKNLSLTVIESLCALGTMQTDVDELSVHVESWVVKNGAKLRAVYERHVNRPGVNPFVMQPESILVWMLIERHPGGVLEEWQAANWDVDLLDGLATEWGRSIFHGQA